MGMWSYPLGNENAEDKYAAAPHMQTHKPVVVKRDLLLGQHIFNLAIGSSFCTFWNQAFQFELSVPSGIHNKECKIPNLSLFSILLTGLKPSLPLNFLEFLPTVNCHKVFLDQIVYQFYDHCLWKIRWRRNPNWKASIILVLMFLNKVLRLRKHFRDLLENSLECRRLFVRTAQSLDFQIR